MHTESKVLFDIFVIEVYCHIKKPKLKGNKSKQIKSC